MKALVSCLVGALALVCPGLVLAQTFHAPSGAFNIDYASAGWQTSPTLVEHALVVITPTVSAQTICALFSHPNVDVNLPGAPAAASQADVNDRVAQRARGRAGYAMVETPAGVQVVDSIVPEEGGSYTRNFMFAVWEQGRGVVYNLACGAPSEAMLHDQRVDALPQAFHIP